MILLVSCFDTGQLKHGCVPPTEPLSRGAGGLFQMCTATANLLKEIGRGKTCVGEPEQRAPSNRMSKHPFS